MEEAFARKPQVEVKIDPELIRSSLANASRDSFFNRNMAIAVLAAIVFAVFSSWYTGWQSDKRWEQIVQQQQQQIQQLQADKKAK